MATPVFPKGAVIDLLARLYGGTVREVLSTVSVGTAIQALTPYNSERLALVICNLGSFEVFITPDGNPSSSRGIRLGPSGGLIGFNAQQDATLPTLGFSAVATGASSNVFVLEVVRDTALPQIR